ncbi:hypothetical protein [uncultured Corynebacterium sp.]|uniref:hypothetical protein n=1 Tax=uncultured Corynebacterium sp. TaxID=159447 RepID=UPI0025D64121|nr:hypothetical protein [uncultured Corynebacterium sp.]
MKQYAEKLLSLHASALPSRGLRVLGAVGTGVVFTLAISPLNLVWLLLPFAVVLLLVSFWIGIRNKARGLRGNGHAPMRPDDETSVLEGGNVPLRGRWWTHRDQWLPLVAVLAGSLVRNVVDLISSPVLGWALSVVLGGLVTAGAICWWAVNDSLPADLPRLATFLQQDPDWRPAENAGAVAAVLYAVSAFPRGRQIRRDALDGAVAEIFTLGPHAVSAALGELSERREVLITTERERGNVRQDWVSLTPAGMDAVVASFRKDPAHH